MNTSYGAMMQSFKITPYILGVCAFIITLTGTIQAQPFAGGTGTELDPYQIETPEQLDAIRNYASSHFILNNDIDLSTYTSDPLGTAWNDGKGWEPINLFSGTLNGANYKIIGLFINRPTEDLVGLIKLRNSPSPLGFTIKDLTLENVDITGQNQVGALSPANYQSILTNISVTGDISGVSIIGGINGFVSTNGSIRSSTAAVNIIGTEEAIGGIAGLNFGLIDSSHSFNSHISILVDDLVLSRAGGLIGQNEGQITSCSSLNSRVIGNNSVGGLVGNNFETGTILNSHASNNVNGKTFVGGFAGGNSGIIRMSNSSTDTVQGTNNVGGFIGSNAGTIENSYSSNIVIGDNYVGGFAGANIMEVTANFTQRIGKIHTSHSQNTINPILFNSQNIQINNPIISVFGVSNVGGFVGSNGSEISNSYTTSGVAGVVESLVGGFFGFNDTDGNISSVYSSVASYGWEKIEYTVNGILVIEPNSSYVFGAVNQGTVSNSYWDNSYDMNGLSSNLDNNIGQEVSTIEMLRGTSFTGFDFDSTWAIGDSNGSSYPYLQAIVPDSLPGYREGFFTSSPFAAGTGTELDPYQIETAVQLDSVRHYQAKHFILNNDINLGPYTKSQSGGGYNDGKGWLPINFVDGSLNGNSFRILDLFVNRPDEDNVGLFGETNFVTINNLELDNVEIRGQDYVGSLSGLFRDSIAEDIYVTGLVDTSRNFVGGVIGQSIDNSTLNRINATMIVFGNDYVGGIAGSSDDIITEAGVTESNIEGNDFIGGITGTNTGDISVSSSLDSKISGRIAVGGLVGDNSVNGIIEQSSSQNYVIGRINAGGLVGVNSDTSSLIRFSYSEFDTVKGGSNIGGLAGSNGGRILSSYSKQLVIGDGIGIGGFVGHNLRYIEKSATPRTFYSGIVGEIFNEITTLNFRVFGDRAVGGFVGLNEGTILNCFNNADVAGASEGSTGGFTGSNEGSIVWAYTSSAVYEWVIEDYYNSPLITGVPTLRVAQNNSFAFASSPNYPMFSVYWDSTFNEQGLASNITDELGSSNILNGTEMLDQTSYFQFDFDSTWAIGDQNGESFPYLQSVPLDTLPGYKPFEIILPPPFAGGDGTSKDPFQIETPEQLDSIRHYASYRFILNNDINLTTYTGDSTGGSWNSGLGWDPIQFTQNGSGLSGNSYKIIGLYINRPAENFVGFFSQISNSGVINLTFQDANVIGGEYVGILSGGISNGGFFRDILRVGIEGGSVFGTDQVGAITGVLTNDAVISESYSTSSVTSSGIAGGLVGRNFSGLIENSYSLSEVDADQSGGLIGLISSITPNNFGDADPFSINESYFAGEIVGNASVDMLATGLQSGIINSYWLDRAAIAEIALSGTGLTSSEMRDPDNFAGWDFDNVWAIGDSSGTSFPYSSSYPPNELPGYQENIIITPFAAGSGTLADPFQIETAEQLDSIRHYLSNHFVLNNDIDLGPYTQDTEGGSWNGGQGWEPIGNITNHFSGSLSGNNFSINALSIIRVSEDNIGLFGVIDSSGFVKDLIIQQAHVSGDTNVGMLAGRNFGEISNSYAQGDIEGEAIIGGLVGYNFNGSILKSSTSASVLSKSEFGIAGGLVGTNQNGTIMSSHSNSTVVGDIVRIEADNEIRTIKIGGLVGTNINATISQSFFTGSVQGYNLVGGLVGFNISATIQNSYTVSNVIADLYPSGIVGGIGGDDNIIRNSYSSSNLIGFLESETLIGINVVEPIAASTTQENLYWNIDAVEQQIIILTNELTELEMRDSSNFSGFDFDSTWAIGNENGFSYPYLQSIVPDTLPGFTSFSSLIPAFAGGNGTVEDPYQIETAVQLDSVRHHLNSHFVLNNSIDLGPYTSDSSGGGWNNGEGWEPLGASSFFSGSFDGQFFSISNLWMNRPDDTYGGLFSFVNSSTSADDQIKNLIIENADISCDLFCGILAGVSTASFKNIATSGSVTGLNDSTSYAGGILGSLTNNSISNSFSVANVSASLAAGGLTANITYFPTDSSVIRPILSDSYAGGIVSSNEYAGGLSAFISVAEDLTDVIVQSYFYGTLEAATIRGGLAALTIPESLSGSLLNNSNFWSSEITETNTASFGQDVSISDLRNQNTFNGWDFENTWLIGDSTGSSFPYLQSLVPDQLPGFKEPDSTQNGLPIFNGNNSLAFIVDNPKLDLSQRFSIELWIKFDDVNRSEPGNDWISIISKGTSEEAFGLFLNSGSPQKELRFNHFGLSEDSTSFNWTEVQDNTWYHIVITYDGSMSRIYIDGELVASKNVTGDITLNSEALQFGYFNETFSYGLSGSIVDIRVWDVARTLSQIRNNMNLMISGKEQGLQLNWFPRLAQNNISITNGLLEIPLQLENVEFVDDNYPPIKGIFDGAEGWRFIGAPGSEATYDEVLQTIWTQGFTGADSESGSSNVYYYDESNRSWGIPTDATNLFGSNNIEGTSLGKGSLLFLYADDDFDGNDDPFPKTLSLEVNQFTLNDETIPLSYTETEIWGNDGWNLVSNPYPVSLYWLDIVADSANVNTEPFIFIWDHSMFGGFGSYAANYGSPTPVGLPGAAAFDGRIAPFQSFWVKAKGEGAELRLSKDHFITNTQPLKRNFDRKSYLSFNLIGEGVESGTSLIFDENANSQGIPKLYSLSADHAEIFFKENNQSRWLSRYIQSMDDDSLAFDLNLDVTIDGQYILEWDLSTIPEDWQIELIDLEERQVYDLREDASLELLITTNSKADLDAFWMPSAPGQIIKSKTNDSPRFKVIIRNTVLTSNEDFNDLPTDFSLSQNYPNPFNPSTTIEFALPKAAQVRLEVFDILGRQIMTLVNDQKQAGYHEVQMDARHLASGVYIYRLVASDFVQTRTLTLIK